MTRASTPRPLRRRPPAVPDGPTIRDILEDARLEAGSWVALSQQMPRRPNGRPVLTEDALQKMALAGPKERINGSTVRTLAAGTGRDELEILLALARQVNIHVDLPQRPWWVDVILDQPGADDLTEDDLAVVTAVVTTLLRRHRRSVVSPTSRRARRVAAGTGRETVTAR